MRLGQSFKHLAAGALLLALATPSLAVPDLIGTKRAPSEPMPFVEFSYEEFYGRTGDDDGVNFWTGLVSSGALSQAEVLEAFLEAGEYQDFVQLLLLSYYAVFDTLPTSEERTDLLAQLRSGTALESIVAGFLASATFAERFGTELSDADFVTRLYQVILGREPDTGGFAYWLGELTGGVSRETLLIAFALAVEEHANDALVDTTLLYQNLRNRTPTAPELADSPGTPLLALIEDLLVLDFLTRISVYDSGLGEGAAEIVTYDPATQRTFVVNAETTTVDVLDLSDPENPVFVNTIAVSEAGDSLGDANSVAVKNGVLAVAIAADPEQDDGLVAFYDTDTLALIGTVTAGALPDMVTFTPDGSKVLVANEGEPTEDYLLDPEGSVSIIDISGGIASATVETADFTAFNDQIDELRAAGVRIFGPNATVAQDLEPEYITTTNDTAWVTLQENNALAIVDLASATVTGIAPLGTKNYQSGIATLEIFEFPELPVLGTTSVGQDILLGGFSGLFFENSTEDGQLNFITHPDRGPNADNADYDNDGVVERPFPLPDFQPEWTRFTLDPASGEVTITSRTGLLLSDGGTMMTGLPNLDGMNGFAFDDEEPIDLFGALLPLDPFGADMEGIVEAPDGSFWMVDEYRPSIYHFDASGNLIARYVPEGSNDDVTTGTAALPRELAQRRANRGFEGIAYADGKVYAFLQSPLDNPDTADDSNSRAGQWTRIVEFDVATETTTGQYLYPLEVTTGIYAGGNNVDKIGDAVALGGGEFLAIERDSAIGADASKYIFHLDINAATNLATLDEGIVGPGGTLEGLSAEELVAAGIKPVRKSLYLDLVALGYQAGDKPEGLTLISQDADKIVLAVLNDNDFGLADEPIDLDGSVKFNPDPIPVQVGLITIKRGQIDASNRDDGINLRNWPVQSFFQPDAIASYTVGEETYLVTANEGDARDYDGFSEEERVGDLTLDPIRFPDAETLQQDENLGRLLATTANGDPDEDGDFDVIHGYGARSFSIWSASGQLIWDSGSEFARIVAEQRPETFNQNYDDDIQAYEFDARSDDKGTEPEGVVTGMVDGRIYAFIGLERNGGIMVYDVTEPTAPTFVQWAYNPADIAPEGLAFIPAADSPNGKALLVVSHEVSGTTVVYEINP